MEGTKTSINKTRGRPKKVQVLIEESKQGHRHE